MSIPLALLSDNVVQDIIRNSHFMFAEESVRQSLYRPFYRQHVYFSRDLNERVYQLPKLFPSASVENLVICVSGLGGSKQNTCLISNHLPDLNLLDSGTQCFPLYYYEPTSSAQGTLFDADSEEAYTRRDGISDWILE